MDTYAEALALRDRMKEKGLLKPPEDEDDCPPAEWKSVDGEDIPLAYTECLKTEYAQVESEQELEEFLRDHQRDLSQLHNTAYNLFRSLLNLLQSADDGGTSKRQSKRGTGARKTSAQESANERKMGTQEVMNLYFHAHCIPRARSGAKGDRKKESTLTSALQKEIRQNWPDESAISRMWNRAWDKKRKQRVDVTRKVLILLFLATDGGRSAFGNYTADTFLSGKGLSADETRRKAREKAFRYMYERMNYMLAECGFAPLDPRTPFDWMVLYCMCADELEIDSRMEDFLTSIFERENPEESDQT